MQWSFDRKLYLGVGLVVAVLLANFGIAYRNIRHLDEDARSVARSHETLDALGDLYGTVREAQSGMRGFLLTSDRRFLEPYHDALNSHVERVERVGRLTGDNPQQLENMLRVNRLTTAHFAHLDRCIVLSQSGEVEAARKVVSTGEGKRITDQLRDVIRGMEVEENRLLREREQVRSRAYSTAVVTGLVVLLVALSAVGMALWLGGRSVRDRSRVVAVREQREFLRATVTSMGDGVIVTDAGGRVTILNRVAEQLTGWTQREASGRPVEEVFRIVDSGARQTVANPIWEALAEGQVVGLAKDTILISQDGTEWPLDDSAAPIRDCAGRVAGAVLVFKEITERHRIERELAEAGRRQTELLAAVKVSEARFLAFMNNSPAVAFIKDADGRFVYVNEPLTRKFGIPEAGWLGKTDAELWGAEIARPLWEIDLRVLAGGEMVKLLETVPTPDGLSSHWQSYKFPLIEASGERFLAGMAVDVTVEKRAESALRESEEKFRNVLERLAEGVLLAAFDSRKILEANPACLELFGYTAEEFTALTLYDIADHDRASSDANCERVARAEQGCVVGRRKYLHKSGRVLDVDLSASVVSHGGRQAFCVVVRDAGEQQKYEDCLLGYQSELERANYKLQTLSVTDGLTGIRNRGAFDAALAEAFERSARQNSALSLLLIDVDHFKSFNDSFGHLVGDGVLRAVAHALQETVRTTDFLARYGGEEFAVILPDTDVEGAMKLAERCRRAIAGTAWQSRAVTISVGVATLCAETPDGKSLVREADEALYRSKELGRNRVLHGSGTIGMQSTRR